MECDVYARWFGKNPRMPERHRQEFPWQIIARRADGAPGSTWALKLMTSYADAWRRATRMAGSEVWDDVSICSRALMWRPPLDFDWDARFCWCGRCRRPSLFLPMRAHPIMRRIADPVLWDAIMLVEDRPRRCYYCGMRLASMPRYQPRRRQG